MLPCLFSCFASCMRSAELFYGMRVLRGSCSELAIAALERAQGDGTAAGPCPSPSHPGRNPRGFSSRNESMIPWLCRCLMRCSSRDRTPAPSETSGQALGWFWAGSGSRASSSLLLLPVLSLQRGSGGSCTSRPGCYLVMLGMNPPPQLRIIQRTVTFRCFMVVFNFFSSKWEENIPPSD